MYRLLRTLAGSVSVLAALAAAPARAENPPPVHALVLVSNFDKVDAEVEKRLAAEGITLVVRKFAEPVSLDMLKLFDAVLIPDFSGLSTPFFVPSNLVTGYLDARHNIGEIHRYVEAGGGVFFSPLMSGAGPEVAEGCEALLEPWGAAILAAQVRDDAHAGCESGDGPGRRPQYAWTTRIRKSPITAGVKRIWYPTNMLRWDDAYATVPFALAGREWERVVTGMPESLAAHGLQYTTWLPAGSEKPPAIAAVRTVSKGRVAVLGVAPFYTLWTGFADIRNGWVGESATGPISGIFLEKGDGKEASDGLRFLVNTIRWLSESSRAAGFGGYTPEKLAQARPPESAKLPSWLSGWNEQNGAIPIKTLIGARSAFSDGTGTVAEFAAAARKAGCGILVMTETFERMDPKSWDPFVAACREATTNDLVVLPGIDIADVYQNRYLLFGQRGYPSPFMLSADGKAMKQCQYFSLGFGTHFMAIHRPTTSPLPHELDKFFSGVAVYTYRHGQLVDDGMLAYQWQLNNESVPVPLAVHEVYSPAEAEAAATSSVHQLYVFADNVQDAAWYLRAGMAHFWETPALFLGSAGPMVRALSWGKIVADGAELHSPPPETPGRISADSQVPIAEVQLISHYHAERRWLPNTNRVDLSYYLPPSHSRWAFVHITDARGRTAITPALRSGPAPRYAWRCSDRQNFFGFAVPYTGTVLPDIDIRVPVFGSDEGRGFWPHGAGERRGENLAPLLELSYLSPAVTITDARIDQRYWRANWEDVAFDAKSSQGTSRSRVYDANVRYYDFNLNEEYRQKDSSRPMMIKEVTVRLRMPATPAGPVFPSFTSVPRQPDYGWADPQSGSAVTGRLSRGWIDLPVGGYADTLVALSPGLRVSADGDVGFAPPPRAVGPLAEGTSWTGLYVRVPRDQMLAMRTAMGVSGKPPFALKPARGTLESLAYVAHLRADGWATAGTVEPAPQMPYALPIFIEDLNPNWPAAVAREDGALNYFGVFEGRGLARLDATKGGPFFAGNVLTAGEPELRLGVIEWDAQRCVVDANNPSPTGIVTRIESPAELTGKYRVQKTVSVPAGSSVRLEFSGAAAPAPR